LLNPPNYQLAADEIERLDCFNLTRASVEDVVKSHSAHLTPAPPRKKNAHH
jgi:hypothetical protein